MFELNDIIVWVIGILASAIVYAINYWQRQSGKEISRKWLTFGLYVVSLALVLVFGRFAWPIFPSIPVFPVEPLDIANTALVFLGSILGWAGQLLTLLTAVGGYAALPYNLLYKNIFEKIAPLPDVEPATVAKG